MPTNATGRLPSFEDLEAYAVEQWEVLSPPLYSSNITCFFFSVHSKSCVLDYLLYICKLVMIFFVVSYRDTPAFLIATYKLCTSGQTDKFQPFNDAGFPARPFEFKVLVPKIPDFSWLISNV